MKGDCKEGRKEGNENLMARTRAISIQDRISAGTGII
jgi:hypothetical protein